MMADPPRRGSLLVIFLTVFIDLLGFGLVLPLLPIYADQLGGNVVQLGILMASFSAMQFLFSPLWGRLSDRYGRRPIIMIGLAGSVVFYALFAVATLQSSLWMLYVSRFGAGIAGATIATAQAYIADTTTLEKRSKGMALVGMAFGLGFTFGPLIGYFAMPTGEGDPGPIPGIVASILSAIALVIAWFKLPESLHSGSESAAKEHFNWRAWTSALTVPSIAAILGASFVCVFSFANFETTLSLLLKGGKHANVESPFNFSHGRVCLTFAYIGFVLAMVQGGIVRRISGKVSDGAMAAIGAVLDIVGFLILIWAIRNGSDTIMMIGLTSVVAGFAFLTPSLNSLLSRRTDPALQGRVLGVGQSVSSLARIFGSGLGIPLLGKSTILPFATAAGLMLLGLVMVIWAAKSGKDFQN